MDKPLALQILLTSKTELSGDLGAHGQHLSLTGKGHERVVAAARPLIAELHKRLPPAPKPGAGDGPVELFIREGHFAELTVQRGHQRWPVRVAGVEFDALPPAWRDGILAVARREAGLGDEADAAAVAAEASFWDQRYQAQDTGWDLGVAAPPLVRAFGELSPQRAIVVGCGRGHEVRELARRGFEATGIDFAPAAVAEAAELTRKAGLTATLLEHDVFALPGKLERFPLWIEHTCFCAIDPARRPEYVDAAHRTLTSGGLLLALFFTHRRPGGPPFTTDLQELERLFSARFEFEKVEQPPDSHPRRKGEELLVWLRRR